MLKQFNTFTPPIFSEVLRGKRLVIERGNNVLRRTIELCWRNHVLRHTGATYNKHLTALLMFYRGPESRY